MTLRAGQHDCLSIEEFYKGIKPINRTRDIKPFQMYYSYRTNKTYVLKKIVKVGNKAKGANTQDGYFLFIEELKCCYRVTK